MSSQQLLRDMNEALLVSSIHQQELTEQAENAEAAMGESARRFRQMIDALPAAIYTTDAEGRITHFNPACVELSGRTPQIGSDHWSVTWKLYYPDGRPMPHGECPMAIALKEGRVVQGVEAIAERPDGTRIWFTPYPTPLKNAQGKVIGGINMLVDITERKAAEAANDRLAAIVESSGDAIISMDLDGIITSWNDGARRLFGYAAQEMIGKPVTMLIPPDHVDEEPAILQRIRRGERVQNYETVRQRKHGSLVDVSLTVSPIKGAGGRIIGASKVARDITKRKQVEDALRRSQHDLAAELDAVGRLQQVSLHLAHAADDSRALYENIMDAAVAIMRSDMASMQVVDGAHDGLRLLAFRGFEPAFGKIFELIRPDTKTSCSVARRIGRRVVVPDVESCDFIVGTPELEDHRKTGIRAVQSTPLVSRSGRLLGVISTHWRQPHQPSERDLRLMDVLARQAADWIERLQGEQALRESEARFRMLADNMSQLAWTCDRLGNVTWYNQRWLDYTGMAFDEMKGWDWSKVQHPDHLERVVKRVLRSAKTGEMWEDTFPLRGKDGQYRWFLSRALPIRDDAGNIVCWFGTNTDVTEQREVEAALDMAREAAEVANRSKDKFLAVLSHELRTPLTPVVMMVAAIEHDADLPSSLRDDVAMIRRNIELETKLIDDLLDLSRVTSGKLRLQMRPTSAHDVLRHVVESSARDTSCKRLNVSVDLQASHDQVSADSARLQQVFWNVLRNAIKFTPEGGHISFHSENDRHGKLRLVVRDTGAGIPPDVLPKVFDAFEQGDTKTTRHFGGLGLGLAICKAVVEMHGGTIRAESEGAGKGATFTIELPTVEVPEAHTESPETADEATAAGPARVLLVEDHPDTVRALSRLLGRSGFQVTTANSIASALQLAASEPFDILLSDIGLPDGTGYELMEQISQRHGIKGIALSGYGMEEDIKRSIEAGFADHVVKPVDLAHLETVVRHVVRGGRADV